MTIAEKPLAPQGGRLPYLSLPDSPTVTGTGILLELSVSGYNCQLSYNAATDSRHLVWLREPPVELRQQLEEYIDAMVMMRAEHAQLTGHPHAGRWHLLRLVGHRS